MTAAELRAAWRELDLPRRRAIRRSIERGEPVDAPEDAGVAVALANKWLRQERFLSPIMWIGVAVFLVANLIADLASALSSLVLWLVIGTWIFIIWVDIRHHRRLRRAVAKNLELLRSQTEMP